MVMAQKSSANTVTTIGIGALSGSNNYQTTFAFDWVRIFNCSNVPQRYNPYTIRYSVPAAVTLNPLTTYSSSSLILNQGVEV